MSSRIMNILNKIRKKLIHLNRYYNKNYFCLVQEGEEGDFERKRQRQRRLKTLHKIEDIFEPQELEKNLLTERDQQIRIEDKPERFMLRSVPVTSEPDEFELENEATWIYRQAFSNNSITFQVSNQVLNLFLDLIYRIKDL